MGGWWNEPMSKMQNGPAQRYSKMSNLKMETENSLPQRHSKMSNGRLSGVLCWPHGLKRMYIMHVKNIAGWFRTAVLIIGQREVLIPQSRDQSENWRSAGVLKC